MGHVNTWMLLIVLTEGRLFYEQFHMLNHAYIIRMSIPTMSKKGASFQMSQCRVA